MKQILILFLPKSYQLETIEEPPLSPLLPPTTPGGFVFKTEAELEEQRASLLDLDLLKVDHSPLSEHSGVVRKKSRHDSDSGSQVRNEQEPVMRGFANSLVFQVLGMMGNMRKHELAQNEQ